MIPSKWHIRYRHVGGVDTTDVEALTYEDAEQAFMQRVQDTGVWASIIRIVPVEFV